MPAEMRFLAFWSIAVGESMIRWTIAVGGGELPREYYLRAGGKMFDFALDAVVGAIALIVGIWFYMPDDNRIKKPGTDIFITPADIASCSFVTFVALAIILPLQILSGSYGLYGVTKDVVSVALPDLFAVIALATAVIRLT